MKQSTKDSHILLIKAPIYNKGLTGKSASLLPNFDVFSWQLQSEYVILQL